MTNDAVAAPAYVGAPPIDALAAALAAFQSEMPTVSKTKTADTGTFRYKYADLADVTEAAMPLLAKHGLSFVTLPGTTGLVGLLLHKSGQRLEAVLPITGATPQQVGSSLTYMRRYLLGCMTGIVTDDDDDGRQAEAAARAPRPRRERPPVAPPPVATPEHPAPDGSVDVPLPDPGPPHAGDGLMRAMHAGLGEVLPSNLERGDRLAIVAEMVGRPITSTKELTRDEVMRVMGVIERIRGGVAGVEYVDNAWQVLAYGAPS
jgi:hypothetical protein